MTTAVSLFAGIGGIDLAVERAGGGVTAACEIDKSCRAVLERHFPKTTLFSDVRELTADDIIDTGFCQSGILAAGWPCQGNSVAGHRKGMADPRSGLWREVARILAELRPRWFVGENVPGLLSVRGGADFRQVIQDLDGLGYGVAWRVLDAQYFGVPQRRRRVLIAGCLGDPARAASVLLEPEGSAGDSAESGEAGESIAGTAVVGAGASSGLTVRRIAPSLTANYGKQPDNSDTSLGPNLVVSTLQGGGKRGYRVDAEAAAGGQLVTCVTGEVTHTLRAEGADASEDGTGRGTPIIAFANTAGATNLGIDPTYRTAPPLALSHGNPGSLADSTGVRRLTPLECERLQGFPDEWTEGQSDSARYRQLGNAVAVPVLEWLMRRIAAS